MSNIRTAESIINARRLVQGPSDGLRAVAPLKYPWTREIKEKFVKNTWFPTEISLTDDARDIKTLREKTGYSRALAFLSNLDAFQLDNLAMNIAKYVTAPEVKTCINRQVWEEEVHVESYSLMIESTHDDPMEIYDMYRMNPLLSDKNDFITAQSDQVGATFTLEGFIKAVVSNCVLEGVYFFSGFLTFYAIARGTNKMLGSADAIRYIQRDELAHLDFFAYMWWTLRNEAPEVFTADLIEQCREIVRQAVIKEVAWGKHVIEEGIIGLNDQIVEQFIQHRADEVLKMLGLQPEYNVVNPVDWFYEFSKVNNNEGNFFETKPGDYVKGGLEW